MQRTAILAGVVIGSLMVPAAQAKDPVERLTAFAVDMSTTPDLRASGGRSGRVNITIDRWSTEQERNRLKGALKEGGPDLLLKELQRIDDPAGRIATPGNIGTPLRFAWQSTLSDGARRIVVATDRRIGYLESVNRPRSIDYPFLVLDIRMNSNGKGEGKLLPLARIESGEDGILDVESYASEPVRLTQVEVVK